MNSFPVDFPAKLLASDAECICVKLLHIYLPPDFPAQPECIYRKIKQWSLSWRQFQDNFQDSLPFSRLKRCSVWDRRDIFPLPHVCGKMLGLLSIAEAQVHLDCAIPCRLYCFKGASINYGRGTKNLGESDLSL